MWLHVLNGYISLFQRRAILEQELTDRLNAPVVFAHNDLLSGNLMLNEEKGTCDLAFRVFIS